MREIDGGDGERIETVWEIVATNWEIVIGS